MGDPILYANNPAGMSREVRRRSLDALQRLNELELAEFGDPETLTRISQYELAYRMQIAVPEVMDISKEPKEIIELYGAEPGKASFANNCLLARRLAEQGVRYVQLYDWGWDTHGTGAGDDIMTALPNKCKQTDRAITALLKDLKQRGLLADTLVVWGGEFGRTAMNEERGGSKFLGRDHHPHCFTIWMAGGGVKAGHVYGATDDLGYFVTEDKVGVHDLQATILHLLGIDAKRFSYPVSGAEPAADRADGRGEDHSRACWRKAPTSGRGVRAELPTIRAPRPLVRALQNTKPPVAAGGFAVSWSRPADRSGVCAAGCRGTWLGLAERAD